MKWNDINSMQCSVARSLSVLGDRWTLLIVRNAFMGMRRFEQFQSNLGMTRHVLSDRLSRLVDANIFAKHPYQDNPPRHEYRLTPKGKGLYPVLLALTAWGDEWLDEGQGPPLLYKHQLCGSTFTPTMACSCCAKPVRPQDVQPVAGPGLTA